jgi:salicylate hydroxylase
MIAQLKTALKWKLCHHEELETWVKGCLALLGDSSHPTLPYQAQGAAMAVEDGLVIGTLLGRLNTCGHLLSPSSRQKNIHGVLQLYEKLRKERTTINVKGAIEFRDFYHLPDGEEQIDRDQVLRDFDRTGDWPASCKWHWGNEEYQQYLLGFDVVDDANQRFDAWQNAASL